MTPREYSNYDFLSESRIQFGNDAGRVVRFDGAALDPLGRVLQEFEADAHFEVTFVRTPDNYLSLAVNKDGVSVAGVLPGPRKGLVLLLPLFRDTSRVIQAILDRVLPELLPSVFPSSASQAWIHTEPYELREVLAIRREIEALRDRALAEEKALVSQIERARSEARFLYDLLTASGDQLVVAVRTALGELGFRDVVDVDGERKGSGHGSNLREDLLVKDRNPILVVDIKGLNGMPSDGDCGQASKHAIIRIRETQNAGYQGLMVINHQRNVPPLGRGEPFRQEMIEHAQELGYGLLTTRDLHRLVRSHIANGWSQVSSMDALYAVGVVTGRPTHLVRAGTFLKLFPKPKAVTISLLSDVTVSVGDRLVFECPLQFMEMSVKSIQRDGAFEDLVVGPADVGFCFEEWDEAATIPSHAAVYVSNQATAD